MTITIETAKLNKFYVYVYLDTRKSGKYIYENYCFDYQPFYIGKGSGNRAYIHLNESKSSTCNGYKYNTTRAIIKENKEPKIILLAEFLKEDEAYELEKHLIDLIGRKDNKTGLLTNLTAGGLGGCSITYSEDFIKKYRIGKNNPFFGKKHSKESLKRMSEISKKKKGKSWEELMGKEKAKKYREEQIKRRKGKKLSEIYDKSTAEKMYKNLTTLRIGTHFSEESIQKMSESHKGEKNYFYGKSFTGKTNSNAKKILITFPNGEQKIIHGETKKFKKENNISNYMFYKLKNKEIEDYKGIKIKYLNEAEECKCP